MTFGCACYPVLLLSRSCRASSSRHRGHVDDSHRLAFLAYRGVTDTAPDLRPPLIVNRVSIANATMHEAVEEICAAAANAERRSFFFANADCLNIAAQSADYHDALRAPGVKVYADGIGVRLAGWISRRPVVANVNGTDMFPLLCERAAQRGLRVFFLGAAAGVARRAADEMLARYPDLKVAGVRDGFFDHENCDDVLDEVNRAQAHILMVAFGAPRQELFIHRCAERLTAPVRMGVGGLFDFYSGDKPRAPRWVRRVCLEWAWRLAVEPRRLWRRYLVGNPLFLARVVLWQLRGRNR